MYMCVKAEQQGLGVVQQAPSTLLLEMVSHQQVKQACQ